MRIWRFLRISLVISVLVLFGLELGLRALGMSNFSAFSRYPDADRGFTVMPGVSAQQSGEGFAQVDINRFGYRDRDWAPKADGVWRIAVLGDSFTEAVQVDIEQTWWRRLEALLNERGCLGRPVEILNFAHSGYSNTQSLVTLRRDVARHRPDEVLLAFFSGNDVLENHPTLAYDPIRPFLKEVSAEGVVDELAQAVGLTEKWRVDYAFRDHHGYRAADDWTVQTRFAVLEYSYLAQQLVFVWDRWRVRQLIDLEGDSQNWQWEPGIDVRVYAPPKDAVWDQAWQLTRENIRLMRDAAQDMNAEFKLISMSNGAQVAPQRNQPASRNLANKLGVPDLFFPEWQLGQIAEKLDVPYLPLAPGLARRVLQENVYLHGFGPSTGIGHWNETGHRFAADLLANQYCASH